MSTFQSTRTLLNPRLGCYVKTFRRCMKPLCHSSFMTTIIYVKHLKSIYVLSVKYQSLQTRLWVLAPLHSLCICLCSFKVGQPPEMLTSPGLRPALWKLVRVRTWISTGSRPRPELGDQTRAQFLQSSPQCEFPCRAQGHREARVWRCRSHTSSPRSAYGLCAVAFPYGTEQFPSLRKKCLFSPHGCLF